MFYYNIVLSFLIHVTFVFQLHKSNVQRRYNDFVAFHEVLLLRYTYRLVPRLPPKKIVGKYFVIKSCISAGYHVFFL